MSKELTEIYSQEFAQKKLDRYSDAEDAILLSQEYKVSDREQKRAMLNQVSKAVEKWENIVLAHKKLKDKKICRGLTISRVGYRA